MGKYQDILTINETIINKRSNIRISYKNTTWSSIKSFLSEHKLAENLFIRLKRLGYSNEIVLLYLLNELVFLNEKLHSEIDAKLGVVGCYR